MDYLEINELQLKTKIGTYAWEQQVEQTVLLSFKMGIDAAKIAAKDDLADTVDYIAVSECLAQYLQEHSFKLLETLADKVAMLLMDTFKLSGLQLKACKPNVAKHIGPVCVTLERGDFS